MYKKAIYFIFGLLCMRPAFAQTDQQKQFIGFMKEVSDAYLQDDYLSFDLAYRFSSEDQPAKIVDSLSGSYKINHKDYWFSLDQTEGIGTADLNLMLFKEDKIMYLSKKKAVPGSVNPLAMLDSALWSAHPFSVELSDAEGEKTMRVLFAPGYIYQSVEYVVDPKTSLLKRIRSVVRADQFYDPSLKSALEPGNHWFIVNVDFSNYRKNNFDKAVFDLSRYFEKRGQEYIAKNPYEAYKVFAGSTGL